MYKTLAEFVQPLEWMDVSEAMKYFDANKLTDIEYEGDAYRLTINHHLPASTDEADLEYLFKYDISWTTKFSVVLRPVKLGNTTYFLTETRGVTYKGKFKKRTIFRRKPKTISGIIPLYFILRDGLNQLNNQ
jgi:hypothetical protein